MNRQWLRELRPSFRDLGDIYSDSESNRQFDAQYFVMIVMSCMIALLGLLLNSPAVIIGAMLISPLMGPILSCGLALTVADGRMGRKAAVNIVFSVVEAVAIAALATALIPLKDATPEILARSNPNLMDLLVAFFSGIAGTLALCVARGGMTILPGVAIATAVMPPLATTGYGISTRQWDVAAGAFMLFFTNLTAIIISADLVFLVVGFRPTDDTKLSRHRFLLRWRVAAAVVILGVLSVPLMQTLTRAVMQARLRKEIRAVIVETVEQPESGARLSSFALGIPNEGPLLVEGTIRTAKVLHQVQLDDLKRELEARIGRPVRLEIQQVQLAIDEIDKGTSDYLAGGAQRQDRPMANPDVLSPENAISLVEKELDEVGKPLGLRNIAVSSIRLEAGKGIVLEFEAEQPAPTHAQAWTVVAAGLQHRLKSSVMMKGRIAVTGSLRFEVQFAQDAADLAPAEQRRMQSFLARVEEQGLLPQLLAPGPATLSDKRLKALVARFPRLEVQRIAPQENFELVAVQRVEAACCEQESPALTRAN